MEHIVQSLENLYNDNRYRQRTLMTEPQGVHVVVDQRQYLSFSSNDYLGLANDSRIKNAFIEGINRYGVGSGAAHLITGHFEPHHALEVALAQHTGRSRALLFSTGYMANLGVIDALSSRGNLILQDRLNHASLIDGGLLSRATVKRYQHANLIDLEQKLQAAQDKKSLIVTDSVFSMDGDIAPLNEIVQLSKKYGAQVFVDDAHGIGVLGQNGGGVCEMLSLENDDEPIIMGTLGKAFGVFGAFVAGSEPLIEWLIQRARPYIYTTALPPAVAVAALESLKIIRVETHRREQLNFLISHFRKHAKEMGLAIMPSTTPIQPVLVGEAKRAVEWSDALSKQGILVKAIRPPTVQEGASRLRITFSASHSVEDVDFLLAELEKLV